MVAKKLLEQREGEIAQGKVPGVYFDKVTFEELAEGYLTDYKANNKKSLLRAQQFVGHLSKHFGGMRVSKIDTSAVWKYIEARLTDGISNATVNRETAALRRMMNISAKAGRIDRVPHIPRLKEDNIRKGFFEHAEFLALRDALPEYLRGFVTFAYRSGWRKSEIADLKWSQVDLAQGAVTLNPGETKNDAGRTIYLDDELKQVLIRQQRAHMQSGMIRPEGKRYVFTNAAGTDKIKEFKATWKRACVNAGLGQMVANEEGKKKWEGKIFHDFRRTAIRNMVRAGIPERVAMMVSGHKTRSVFDRYNIVSDTDLRAAAESHAAYLSEKSNSMGTLPGTLLNFPAKKENRGNA